MATIFIQRPNPIDIAVVVLITTRAESATIKQFWIDYYCP
jgi:tRNA (Thr-GGU) A37 N-methylase